jgi:hypothetical protein
MTGADARGIYRTKYGWATADSATVANEDGGERLYLSERNYKLLGYEPPFEKLPWIEDYVPK